MGALSQDGVALPCVPPSQSQLRAPIERRDISAPSVLNEAYSYARPSSFSRALAFEIADTTVLRAAHTFLTAK